MGGPSAVALAAQRPDLVASLTLISPALPHPRVSASALWFTALATPRLGPVVLERSRRLPFDRRFQASLAMVFGDPRSLAPEVRAAYEAELRRRDTDPWVEQATVEAPGASCGRRWRRRAGRCGRTRRRWSARCC